MSFLLFALIKRVQSFLNRRFGWGLSAKTLLDRVPHSKHIAAISKALDRKPEEKQALESKQNRMLKFGIFFGAMGITLALFGPPLWTSFQNLSAPIEPIGANPDLWAVSYEKNSPEKLGCSQNPVAATCPAHGTSAAARAWWSPERTKRRKSAEHRKWTFDHQGEPFWLEARFSKDVLERAGREGANYLLIGYLVGKAKIWVDGELVVDQETRPLSALSIPLAFSNFSKPALSVVIRLTPTEKIAYPDFLNEASGREGFVRSPDLDWFNSYQDFINRVRPFSLFVGNLLIALTFLFFWSNVTIKQEYFYLSLFALIESANQLRMVDWVRTPLSGNGLSYHYIYASRLGQGILALLLGIAFSRKSRPTFLAAITIMLAFSIGMTIRYPGAIDQFRISAKIAMYWTPLCTIIGALTCLVTAYALNSNPLRKDFLALRVRRLISFAGALFFFGIIQYLFSGNLVLPQRVGVLQYFSYFGSVIVIGGIILRDYRESEQLRNDLTSLSEILELAKARKPVSGAALYVDLKGSELLIRQGEAQGDSGLFLRQLMKHLCDALGQSGGVRFTIDGDMVKVFYPNRGGQSGALLALDGVRAALITLEREAAELRSISHLKAGPALAARFGLAIGNVRALIADSGPIFEHIDETSPLLDAARMLSIEETLFKEHKHTSLVVMTTEAKAAVASEIERYGEWFEDELHQAAKHGIVHAAAVLRPYQFGFSKTSGFSKTDLEKGEESGPKKKAA